MFKTFINNLKSIDKITYKIMKNGFKFCFILSLISSLILIIYKTNNTSPNTFYIGFSLFRLSIIFFVEFIICGISADYIKKQIT